MTDLLSSRSLSCPNPICFNNLMYQRHPKAAKVETAQILQIIFESEQSENQILEVIRSGKEEKGCQLGHCSVILFDIWFGLEHGAISSGGADWSCIVKHFCLVFSGHFGTALARPAAFRAHCYRELCT